ncbi:MAG: Lrp/AsnC family transcriptional regulator [Enhydrobacter sp.]|nr:MAG: Lrp/AsnC family transcriptional regulator [Enhydrobacter sp.]
MRGSPGSGLLCWRRSRKHRQLLCGRWPLREKIFLDPFDRKILDCLQHDADMPLAEIARRVGLSATPCWRRINRLRERGVIRAKVALLDRKAVNAGVTVFVAVRTNQHTAQWLSRFARAIASFPEVMDCYRMSGEIDYLIRLALPDIEAYDAFYKRLIARVELSDVTSMFAMEEIKSTTRLPLSYLP